MFKIANQGDKERVQTIMQKIHDENPAYWPYGLSADQFDSGGLYLVQKQASTEPVGFVGWQQMNEGGRRVGYYAIGILPEYREQGFAKQAVAGVIREMGGRCDEVKALIMASNTPSKALANSLGIPIVEKSASKKELALSLLSGLATTGLLDAAVNKDRGAIGVALGNPKADKWSLADAALNFGAGMTRNKYIIAGAAGKTVATPAVRNQARGNDLAELLANNVGKLAPQSSQSTNQAGGFFDSVPKGVWVGAGGLGLGALGLLAYKLKSEANHRNETLATQRQGQIKITLPTKKPGDAETQVALPFTDLNLSNALRNRLGRDTKRRLHQETKERTRRRKPSDPSNPTEKELEDAELERELAELDVSEKSAAIVDFAERLIGVKQAMVGAPQSGLPTPPPLGLNPALRMSQQQAAAAAVPMETKANPQIEQAQMQAAQSEQAAQAQVAQAQQAAAESNMQQQAQFQQELMKAKTENDTLKLQLEKQKAIGDLAAAKDKARREMSQEQMKSQVAAGDGRNSTMTQVAKARLGGIKRRLAKAASAATTSWKDVGYKEAPAVPQYDAMSGGMVTRDNRPLYLDPSGAQRLNDSLGSAAVIPDVGNHWRHSYGKMGDWAYDMFFKNRLQQHAPAVTAAPSYASFRGSPDLAYAIQNSLARAHNSMPANGLNPLFAMGMSPQ